jgi:glutamyl-tRNA reductase
MSILLLGLNHRTAPVEVRERLAFSREGAANALMLFARQFPKAEAVIISTCNRVEILVNTEVGSPDGAREVVEFLSRARNIPAESFAPYLYQLDHAASVRHLFRVISGLDSIVVGECQVVNQVKQAYALAHEQGTCGPVLHRLLHHAFGVSKRTRGETKIAEGKLSVPSVAMDIVRRACPHPSRLKVLVVGAGDMAQHACRYLSEAAVAKLVVTSRTYNNARTLADACGGAAVPYADLDRHLAAADVVITATSCPTAILTEQRVSQATACREGIRPLVLIDLSVPRNIDPAAGRISGVKLYDIDSLVDVVKKTSRGRARAVGAAEAIIDEEVAAFDRWINDMRVAPLIGQMYRDVRELAEVEVRRLFNRCPDLSTGHKDEVTQLVDRLVGKLLHPCVSAIRQGTSLPPQHVRGVFETETLTLSGAPALEQYA